MKLGCFLVFASLALVHAIPGILSTEIERINKLIPKADFIDDELFHESLQPHWLLPSFLQSTPHVRGIALLKKKLQKVLEKAAYDGDYKTVENLLMLAKQLIDPTANQNKALTSAILKGHSNIVKLLLDSYLFKDPEMSLVAAAKTGRIKLLNMLMDSLKIEMSDLETAAESAVINGQPGSLRVLLSRAKVNPAFNDNRLVKLSAWHGRPAMLKQLLKTGKVDPTVQDNFPIKIASKKGYWNMVRVLLGTGKVDPSAAELKNPVAKAAAKWYAWSSGYRDPVQAIIPQEMILPPSSSSEAQNNFS